MTLLAVVALVVAVILVAILKDRDITIDAGNEGPKKKSHIKISIKKPRNQNGKPPKALPMAEESPACRSE